MSSNPAKSEATNAETTARNPKTGDIQKPTEGVDTQTGSQAKGMGSDEYTKHRFSETPGESDYTKHRFNETPSEAAASVSGEAFGGEAKKYASDWLGGPQNGNETPSKSTEEAYQQNGQSDRSGTGKSESDYTTHRFD
jgi:hypothetical protein